MPLIGGRRAVFTSLSLGREMATKWAEAAWRPPRSLQLCLTVVYQVLALEQAPVPAGEQVKLSVPFVLVSTNVAVSVGEMAVMV